MNIDVYNTHIEVYPYSFGDYPIIESWYTAKDKFTNTDFPCGYLIQDNKLYLPRGTSISHLESMTGGVVKFIKKSDPYEKMTTKFYPLYEPRNEIQEESIKFLKGDNAQLTLNLLMGGGKTYCVAYAVSEINDKVLVITPNEGIKLQWIKTFRDMFDYRSKHIMNIAGSYVIEGIMNDEIDIKDINVFLVNHQTLHSYMFNNNGYMFHRFFKKLKVGIKVYDESHLNFMNILLIDFFTNTKKTIYLSATFSRSDKTEAECFKRAFNSTLAYGEQESLNILEKHVVYHIVNINSKIDHKNRARLLAFPGYAEPVSRKIPCPNGCIRMGDLQVGDYIFGSDGSKNRVEEIFDKGELDVYQITFSDGRIAMCSLDHLWRVRVCDIEYVLSLHDIMTLYRDNKVYIPILREPVQFEEMGIMKNAYHKGVEISFTHEDIPDEYLYNSYEVRAGLLFTIIENSSFVSENKELLEQLQFIARSLGFEANIKNNLLDVITTPEDIYIKHIKLSHREECRCIRVSANNALYLTEDFIVTHNTSNKFGVYAFTGDPNQTMYNTIKSLIKLTENLDGKTLIFVPLIEAVDSVASNLRRDFPDKRITPFHSKMSKDEKENMEKYDIIVSTIKSAGTGKDIPGLRVVINSESFASTVLAQQVFGRLRPYAKDKETFFFDIVDTCIPQCNYYFRARFKKIETLAKKVVYLDINK